MILHTAPCKAALGEQSRSRSLELFYIFPLIFAPFGLYSCSWGMGGAEIGPLYIQRVITYHLIKANGMVLFFEVY